MHKDDNFKLSLLFFYSRAFATRDSDRVPTDVCALLVLPLFHTYGLFVLNVFLTGGSKIVLLPKFEAEQYLQCVEKYKVYFFNTKS